jgi:lipopolysaccharide transport system permease protein
VILPVLIQLWMFASPVVYPSSLVPAHWRWAYALNPLSGIIEGFRSSLLNQRFDWLSLAISAAMALLLLAYSLWVFKRVERDFADVI